VLKIDVEIKALIDKTVTVIVDLIADLLSVKQAGIFTAII